VSDLRDDLVETAIVSSDVAFEGKVWNIRRERFTLGADTITREFMDHTGAVAVLALDERGRVLLIRQYRHPVRTKDWELPAGLLDIAGESPLVAAQRELAEEADLVAESWDLLSEYMTSPGGSNEVIRIYLARGVSAAAEVFTRTEEEAGIELRWVDLGEAVDAVLSRDLQNSVLAIAVLSARALQARGWEGLADPNADWPRHPGARR
jgi:8-oxo-dGTP pyrophosphatase MutT (NUDIX family)